MVQSDKPRILVVDDEPMNTELLQAYLQYDYEVIPAYSGQEALDIVSECSPDIVLLDVMMPGINGYKVCEKIKSSEATEFIPVVLVTALSGREERLRGIEAKADDFLTKPVELLELKMRVKSLLRIKNLHDNLVRERDQAQNYLDVAAVMMLVLDSDLSISLINKRGLDILGYEEDEILGQDFLESFIPGQLQAVMKKNMSATLASTDDSINYSECPVITKDKNRRIVSWYCKSLTDESGRAVGVLCSGQDITQRTLAEEKLKIHTRAMEASIDGMGIMNGEGVYTYVNKAYARIFGYNSPEELINRPWNMLYGEPEAEKLSGEIIPGLRLTGEWKGELEGKKKDGKSFFQEMSLTAMDDGIISVVRDISERKDVERQLNQYATQLKNSNELKDLFTDILRHDLLNPAGVVKGFTDMLLGEESDKGKRSKLELIDSNIIRLIGMIESAAKYAKLEDIDELEFMSMDLKGILRNVIEEFEPQSRERGISIELGTDAPHFAVVNPLIEGVFGNFISNAIKYAPWGSPVYVDIEDAGDEWKVTVTDMGDGIPDEDKQLVFNRFNRLNSKKKAVKGSGLGLAIAKRTIELHGGFVGVSDNPKGKGSVFWATVKKAQGR